MAHRSQQLLSFCLLCPYAFQVLSFSLLEFLNISPDIIVSCAGTIGETYIMPDEIEQGIINQALMRVTLAEGIDKKFFQYYFDANLKKSAQEESNGSAIFYRIHSLLYKHRFC